MFKQIPLTKIYALIVICTALFVSGCIKINKKVTQATLLDATDATKPELIQKVNNFAKVNSMRAFMALRFEDITEAKLGKAKRFRSADGEVVVQRPAKIFLKVKVPVIKTDIVQMTSDGKKFRVAILQDGGSGKYKKFVSGTNATDYSLLQERVDEIGNGDAKEIKENVNAFSNLRPQHFTDAMLVRPIDDSKYAYVQSSILQEEFDLKASKKSPTRWVLRGYYLLDEFKTNTDGSLSLIRRFWFDRVGKIRLARQQIFDPKGEIESDIVYGLEGSLTETGNYILPLQVEVTRPKENYKMRLKYQSPKAVKIGKIFKDRAFVLENRWNLEELNLDEKLQEAKGLQKTTKNKGTKTGFVKDN